MTLVTASIDIDAPREKVFQYISDVTTHPEWVKWTKRAEVTSIEHKGIGATTAVFSIVDGMLYRSMSYKDSDRLYRILEFSQGAGGGGDAHRSHRVHGDDLRPLRQQVVQHRQQAMHTCGRIRGRVDADPLDLVAQPEPDQGIQAVWGIAQAVSVRCLAAVRGDGDGLSERRQAGARDHLPRRKSYRLASELRA